MKLSYSGLMGYSMSVGTNLCNPVAHHQHKAEIITSNNSISQSFKRLFFPLMHSCSLRMHTVLLYPAEDQELIK